MGWSAEENTHGGEFMSHSEMFFFKGGNGVERGLGVCLELSLKIQQLVVINHKEARPPEPRALSPKQGAFGVVCQ